MYVLVCVDEQLCSICLVTGVKPLHCEMIIRRHHVSGVVFLILFFKISDETITNSDKSNDVSCLINGLLFHRLSEIKKSEFYFYNERKDHLYYLELKNQGKLYCCLRKLGS